MVSVLSNRIFRHLFAAQVIALLGTGLMTVALALMAYDLVGAMAGPVLGTALAIKMIVYVTLAPIAAGIAAKLPRRGLLVTLDLVRASVAVALPFVDQVWQIYLLIALLQSASAAFTPTFQATIPDVLTDEEEYTRALSLSRLAYDLENLISPVLAAALVSVVGFHWLFAGTVFGFVGSAALVVSVVLPHARIRDQAESALARTARGIRIYLSTPRLRGLLALNLSVAAVGAMVIVNTVVVVQEGLGLSGVETAIAFAAFGAGSMAAALALPAILTDAGDRVVMLRAAFMMPVALLAAALAVTALPPSLLWPMLLGAWLVLGACSSSVQVPTGRLLRRSTHGEDRPAVFAAQFALSHGCWLITYPLAGWLGSAAGMPATLAVLALLAAIGTMAARRLWPVGDPHILRHEHPDLPPDHPHLAGSQRHAHAYIIDDLHPHWPVMGR